MQFSAGKFILVPVDLLTILCTLHGTFKNSVFLPIKASKGMRPLVRIINLQDATLFRVNGKDKNKGDMVTMLGVNYALWRRNLH
jgi:hypothetical protein